MTREEKWKLVPPPGALDGGGHKNEQHAADCVAVRKGYERIEPLLFPRPLPERPTDDPAPCQHNKSVIPEAILLALVIVLIAAGIVFGG